MNRQLFIADYKRLCRQYPSEQLPEAVADYVKAMPLMPAHWGDRIVKVDKIIGLCCQHFGVRLEQMAQRNRTESIKYPRQVTIYLLAKRSGWVQERIAELFNRDRTTVVSSRERIQDLIDTDPDIRDEILQLNAQL